MKVNEGKRRFGEGSAKVNLRPRSATFGHVENSGVMNDRYCNFMLLLLICILDLKKCLDH